MISAGAAIRAVAVLALALPIGQANAQRSVRILTPTMDDCHAFTQALAAGDKVTMAVMGGWALGYMSGIADGTGVNFLGRVTADEIYRQLDLDCRAQPRLQFSAVVSSLARSLMAGYRQ